jgi:dihydrofolate reductase
MPRSSRSKTRAIDSKLTRKRQGQRKSPASSGRVHLYVGISLDGYIAAPDGGVDWLNPYADARSGFAPFIKSIGSIVMGRTTYDHAVAKGYAGSAEMPSYVVTHRPFDPPSKSIVPFSGSLPDLVARIRDEHPGDIWLMGGGGITKSFQEMDLIDIWTIAFVPALLGDGLPMFPRSDFNVRRLQLVRTHRYSSGVIELRYERAVQPRSRR